MAVILDECPEVGLIVNLRLHNHVLNIGYELTARIVHVTPAKDSTMDRRPGLLPGRYRRWNCSVCCNPHDIAGR